MNCNKCDQPVGKFWWTSKRKRWCEECFATMRGNKKEFDAVGFIIDFESGDLDDDAIIDGFQHLIDDGTAWSLQGSYGRMAQDLIQMGHCRITNR